MDSKSIGLCPQGFESPRCRLCCTAGEHTGKRNPIIQIADEVRGTWCSGIAPARMREAVNLKVGGAGLPAGVFVACHKCFGGRRREPALETNARSPQNA